MLKIEPNGETYLTRGDTAFIKPIVEVEDEEKPGKFTPYEFQENDRVIFRLALNSNSPVLVEKDCYIDLENNKAVLTINPEDTQDQQQKQLFDSLLQNQLPYKQLILSMRKELYLNSTHPMKQLHFVNQPRLVP